MRCAYGLAKVLWVSARPDPGGSRVGGLRYNDRLTRNLHLPAPSRRLPRRPRMCGRGGLAVGRERVGHRAGLLVEEPLRQPCHRCGDGRRQVGHSSETGQDVVGSHGRCHVPHNQAQYRTGPLARPIGRSVDDPQVGDRGTGVERPDAVLRLALDLYGLGVVEGGHGGADVLGVDAVQAHLPDGCGEPLGQARGAGLHRVDDVEAVRHRRVEQSAQDLGVPRLGEGDLQELRLTARAGGCGIGVGDLGVGVKPAEYAIGTSERRSARSKARWKSRWLVNRRRPRLV